MPSATSHSAVGSPMAEHPELSVIVVSHQCRDDLLNCIADLDAARRVLPLEVLVIDNASTDGTVDAVTATHPWVTIQKLNQNLGFGRANNQGIVAARSPTVLLLNPDTRITPDALCSCVSALRSSPEVGVLSPRVIDESGRFDRNCKRGFPTVWSLCCYVTGLDRLFRNRGSQRYGASWLAVDRTGDVEAVSGAVMFCRADALHAVGGFDERFFMFGEDLDLCLRIGRAGWRIRYWPGATVLHLGGRSGLTPASRRAWAHAIGHLHRIHRSGIRGRIAAGFCDLAGLALAGWLGSRRHLI